MFGCSRARGPVSAALGKALAFLLLGWLALSARAGATAPPANALQFFKSYFLTGDYAVSGASLWRKGTYRAASGTIPARVAANANIVVTTCAPGATSTDCVPANADVLAAFLYVQTAERVQWSGIDHATYQGPGGVTKDLGVGTHSIARALNWNQATPTCWTVGWPGGRRLVTYRADVLPFVPLDANGRYIISGTHAVQVPDDGYWDDDDDEGNFEWSPDTQPRAIGASLVIVYRDADPPSRSGRSRSTTAASRTSRGR